MHLKKYTYRKYELDVISVSLTLTLSSLSHTRASSYLNKFSVVKYLIDFFDAVFVLSGSETDVIVLAKVAQSTSHLNTGVAGCSLQFGH